jgi:Na+:H+ antiporter, NhaA family
MSRTSTGEPGRLVGEEDTLSETGSRRPSWSMSDRPIPRRVVRPLQEFLSTSTASAFLLFGAVVVALIWANVGDSYEAFWTTELSIRVGDRVLGGDLRFWIVDGLMTLFFLLAGIEIKRELTTGELQDRKAAALPAIAAVGGMIAPALLFVAIVGGGDELRGWGIPMATDIALALGALALAAAHAPTSLRPLLLTLAIVDDIGAIIVIAVFYTSGGSLAALLSAIGVLALMVFLNRVHVRFLPVYVVLGAAVWYLTYLSGVHPTIAGVALGLLIPSGSFQRPDVVSAEARRIAEETDDDPDPPDADVPLWLDLATLSREAVSPLARVEHLLLPWSSFVIVPLFALSESGVPLGGGSMRDALTGSLGIAIVVGLVVGKPLGIVAATWLATATRAGVLPRDVDGRALLGMGATAGIGFTVALFVADLAFHEQPLLLGQAKTAVLVGSAIAGVIGQVILRSGRPSVPA